MPKLPALSARDVIKALTKAGFYVHHRKGSHVVLKRHNPPPRRVVVPYHRELKKEC